MKQMGWKSRWVFGMGFLCMAITANAQSAALTCKSIDVTHRPFFGLQITASEPENVQLTFAKVMNLSGSSVKVYHATGSGEVTGNEFSVTFDGDISGTLAGQKRPNGVISASLEIDGEEEAEEMVCQKGLPWIR